MLTKAVTFIPAKRFPPTYSHVDEQAFHPRKRFMVISTDLFQEKRRITYGLFSIGCRRYATAVTS